MTPYKNETVVWKENYFMQTVNIYEPRGPKYKCTECNEVFNTRLSMLTHSKIHLKPFCVVCGIYTHNVREMQNHMKCKHPSMVEIFPMKSEENPTLTTKSIVQPIPIESVEVDVNQNLTRVHAVKEIQTSAKKQHKAKQTKGTPFGQTKQNINLTKRVISRFGRCISVKTPTDY